MDSARQWNMIEIDDELFVPFKAIDDTPGGSNLGRAEFIVCIKYRRGQVSEFWIYPKQQRRNDCWHYKGGDYSFHITSYEKLDRPDVWLCGYCREHKTQSLNIYVPNDSKFLRVDYSGISFCKTDWSKES